MLLFAGLYCTASRKNTNVHYPSHYTYFLFIAGYLAYIGYVLVEHYHSNPILNVFVNLISPKKDSESKVIGK